MRGKQEGQSQRRRSDDGSRSEKEREVLEDVILLVLKLEDVALSQGM